MHHTGRNPKGNHTRTEQEHYRNQSSISSFMHAILKSRHCKYGLRLKLFSKDKNTTVFIFSVLSMKLFYSSNEISVPHDKSSTGQGWSLVQAKAEGYFITLKKWMRINLAERQLLTKNSVRTGILYGLIDASTTCRINYYKQNPVTQPTC